MSENSKIQWTSHTFNPWRGCSKVNAGCTNCYAEVNRSVKVHGVKWGPNGTRVRLSDAGWKEPLKWNRDAEANEQWHAAYSSGDAPRPRVFCASLADVFEDWEGAILDHAGDRLATFGGGYRKALPGDFAFAKMNDLRADLFRLIDATPHLDWMLLTKRPENIRRMWPRKCDSHPSRQRMHGEMAMRPNVWLGASCSDQSTADTAIPELLKCRDLARVLFVSAEPLIGPIDFHDVHHAVSPGYFGSAFGAVHRPGTAREVAKLPPYPTIDLVITGGESGPHARPCDVEWIRDIGGQCKAAGVKWFNKQLGAQCRPSPLPLDVKLRFVRDPKGGDMDEWPEDLRVREMPT